MAVSSLGYLGIRSNRLEDWSGFAGRLLGMQEFDRGRHQLAFRMDDRKQRFIISDEPGETLAVMGWEVERRDDLRLYADRLDAANVAVKAGDRALADRRFVEDLIVFDDPQGNRIELFCGPMLASDPFSPGRPISGFNTGALGMGHAVLHVNRIEPLLPFYCDLLDFHVSDYSLTPYPLYFFHVNGRHHSFAVVGTGKAGLHHFMVEFNNMDDVGQGYDLADADQRVAYTLGRHTNDYMFSFYAHSPSGFFVENGWGGRVIEPAIWQPHQTNVGPSFWGHERLYLTEEGGRKRMRDMRLSAAAAGHQAPPVADCPWLYGELAQQR